MGLISNAQLNGKILTAAHIACLRFLIFQNHIGEFWSVLDGLKKFAREKLYYAIIYHKRTCLIATATICNLLIILTTNS